MRPNERVQAVLAGKLPDRPPVSFWHHFSPGCWTGAKAVEAHLTHASRFGLDFIKVMNDHRYPTARDIRTAADLRDIPVLRGDEEGYGGQLELIRSLADELAGEIWTTTTVFNAWAVLRRMATPAIADRHGPPKLGRPPTQADQWMNELLAQDRDAFGQALEAIATSQANFARMCIEAGADGIFLSVRDDWVNTEGNGPDTYTELVRNGDLRILDAAGEGRFNMLHVCGVPQDFEAFARYPVHAVNWADRAGGPSIAEVIGKVKPAVCGGVDNLATLPNGTPQDVEEEVRDALRQAGDRPIMISVGCTYDSDAVPEANLQAMVRAAGLAGGS